MKNHLYSAFMTIFCAFLVSGCSSGPDPDKEFGMYLNGKQLRVKRGEPVGYIQELEAGYSYSYRYSVVFPRKFYARDPVPRPGIIIQFDPAEIESGQKIPFGTGGTNAVWVEYYPVGGHKMNQAILLAYSSRHSAGGGKICFDVLEPQLGGRVKGTIIQSTLYGYYKDMETMEITEPPKSRKLELFNWSFDVTLERSIF